MTLPFLRVGKDPLKVVEHFADDKATVDLVAELAYHKNGLIKLSANLKGSCKLACDRCAEDFVEEFDEPVELLLSSGVFTPSDEELSWPVMEMQNNTIDLGEVLQSELAAFVCGYHRCRDCEAGLTTIELIQGE